MSASEEIRVLAADLSRAGPRAEAQARQIVPRFGAALTNLMQAKAPVDTGFLRASIHGVVGNGGLSYTASASAEYAVFLEYGTSRMPPQAFINPSADEIEEPFSAAIERIGGEML